MVQGHSRTPQSSPRRLVDITETINGTTTEMVQSFQLLPSLMRGLLSRGCPFQEQMAR